MRGIARNKGLSLTEVLLAAGILVLGFLLIAGTFPVGIKLTSLATERTISLVAANEAAGKIKLYGVNLNNPFAIPTDALREYNRFTMDPNSLQPFIDSGVPELGLARFTQDIGLYPSTTNWLAEDYVDQEAYQQSRAKLIGPDGGLPQYHWTALCRRVAVGGARGRDVQVTVFVGRKAGAAVWYPQYDVSLAQGPWTRSEWPTPVPVIVKWGPTYEPLKDDADFAGAWVDEIQVDADMYAAGLPVRLGDYFKEGMRIVDGRTGRIMHVGKVLIDRGNGLAIIELLRSVNATPKDPSDDGLFEVRVSDQASGGSRPVWVMPPAMREAMFDADNNGELEPPMVGGRYPGVGVYQWVLSF
jgi:hypothetical protein